MSGHWFNFGPTSRQINKSLLFLLVLLIFASASLGVSIFVCLRAIGIVQ